MVGEELAEVEVANLAEVVDARAVRLRVARIEVAELEDLADEVLGVVGEPVAVGVAVGFAALEHVLPGVEVGDSVAVGVGVVGIGRRMTAVVLVNVGKPVTIGVARAVAIVPGRKHHAGIIEVVNGADQAVLHAVRLEHHVELPPRGRPDRRPCRPRPDHRRQWHRARRH